MTRVVACILALFASTAPAADESPSRTWTDGAGRTLEAAIVSDGGDSVTLRASDGTTSDVPLANLSDADRRWIEAWRSGIADPEDANDSPSVDADAAPPAPSGEWPRVVSLSDLPSVAVVREDSEAREFVYETEHFEFVSDSRLGANVVREFGRLFEVTWLANREIPLGLDPEPEPGRDRFRARIYTTVDGYIEGGGIPNSAGTYSPMAQEMKMPLESLGVREAGGQVVMAGSARDHGTLIHETTHQMMNRWLGRLPIWLVEGSAEYMELAEYQTGRLSFLRRDPRLRDSIRRSAGSGRARLVPLETLFAMTPPEWNAAFESAGSPGPNYHTARVVTYFFYHVDGEGDGKHIADYFRAVREAGGPRRGPDRALVDEHLVRGRDLADLEREILRWLRRLGVHADFAP